MRGVLLLCTGFFLLSAQADPQSGDALNYRWTLPLGFPQPVVPADNPMSAAKVALGALLFKDNRLSVNGTLSCAGCHDPQRHFTENRPRSTGATGEVLAFNAPTLLNAAYSPGLSWIDKGFASLEEQHFGPLTNRDPVELGTTAQQLDVLWQDPVVRNAVLHAYPDADALRLSEVAGALASYVRTLIRGGSVFDDWLFKDQRDRLAPQQRRGLALFNSERLNCAACHRGFLLSGPTRSARGSFKPSFYRTGVGQEGLAVRAPSLRFVLHTAPYMHDGSLASLDAVIDFYARGAPKDAGPRAAANMRPFSLDVAERAALLAFLEAL